MLKLLALATLALAVTTATAADKLAVPYAMFRLANGLTAIAYEDQSAPATTASAGGSP